MFPRLPLAFLVLPLLFLSSHAARPVGAGVDLRPVVLTAHAGRIPSGAEKQLCHRVRFPRRQATDVGRVQMFVRGGSHHVHLYRPYNGAVAYPPHACPFAVDFDKWELVAATQASLLDWTLPRGVAIHFEPRQPLLIQTHFVNTGALKTRGHTRAKILLHPMDPATVQAYAGAFFAQDRALVVPPGRSTVTSRCMITGDGASAHPMTVVAMTGHYHFRGVGFDVFRVHPDGTRGERLYHHDGYDDPRFIQYKGVEPLVLAAGEGIEWSCTYENDGTETYKFGPNTARNEHCNLFGFYYPTATPQEAIDCVHEVVDGVERTRRIVAE